MDRKELETWLNTRPREDAVLIAQRAALRVWPYWGAAMLREWARKRELTSLPVLRSLLASGIARHYPTPEVMRAAHASGYTQPDPADPDPADPDPAAAADAAGAAARAAVFDAEDAVYPARAAAFAAEDAAYAADDENAIWTNVERDVRLLSDGGDLLAMPIWHTEPPEALLRAGIAALEALTQETGDANSFWHRWYLGARDGKWMDWELQRDVALIPDDVWKRGHKAVAEAIAVIEARYRKAAVPTPEVVSLDLAHTDFTYEAARRLMRMVPFDQDISRLRDPATLRKMLNDAEDLRTLLETIVRSAEAAQRQSATSIKVFAEQILAELDRAAEYQDMRVGVLIDLGETLQDFAGDEDVRVGLGPALPRSLDRVSNRLLDLLRDYLAPSMSRTAPLRAVTLQKGEAPRSIVELAQANLNSIADADGQQLPPLDKDDLEVLRRLVEELSRAWRNYEQANDPAIKRDLGDTFARKAYQIAADKALYVKRGLEVVQSAMGGKDNDTADTLLRRIELATTATEIGQYLLELVKFLL